MANSILLVDDSPTQLITTKLALRKAGLDIITATNGLEGIHRALYDQPRLIISDVMMPEINGYQLCYFLKNDERTATVPIILLTSLDDKRDTFWGLRAGADRYLNKPPDIPELLAAIAQLLKTAPEPTQQQLPQQEINDSEVRSQLSNFLETLLFRSTVANETIKLANYIYNRQQFVLQFFELLHNIMAYEAAALLILDNRENTIYLDNTAHLGPAPLGMMIEECLGNSNGMNTLVIRDATDALLPPIPLPSGNTNAGISSSASFPGVVYPLRLEEEELGSLALYFTGTGSFAASSASILKTIADNLASVIKGLVLQRQIDLLRDDFIHTLTHDLRGPLTSIMAAVELIKDSPDPVNEEQQELLDMVMQNSGRLNGMISDLLDLRKLEAGKLKLNVTTVSPYELVIGALRQMQALAKSRGLEITNQVSPTLVPIEVDEKLITRVCTNLLGNAIKFTNEGIVTISAEHRIEQDTVVFHFTDTGRGISSKQIGQLFQKFGQMNQAGSQKIPGTGLGLYFCRQVVESHGGSIWAQSEEGRGSTFSFELSVYQRTSAPTNSTATLP